MIAKMPHPPGRRLGRGFTLIEALVALLVMAFGMLAIAGMQSTLSRAAEVAKQRSEAVRLAQMKIEQLRAFEQVAADAGKVDYASDVVSGNDTFSPTVGAYATNTSFDRTWTVTRDGVNAPAADGSDPQKWVSVVVTWNDRTGQAQRVQLTTVISRADPIKLGTLYTGPGTTEPLKPKGRNIDIPYPAVSLPGDKSAFKPPPSTNNYVFDNVSGDVLGFCTDAAIANAVANGTTVSFSGTVTTGCTAQPAYVLSGYIRFLDSLPSGGTELQRDTAVTNPTTATKALTASINFTTGVPGTGTQAADCFAQQQKVVSVGNITVRDIQAIGRAADIVTVTTTANHGFSLGQVVAINNVSNATFNGQFTIASTPTSTTFTYAQAGANVGTLTFSALGPTAALVQQIALEESATAPTGYNSVVSRFVAYTCIVQGIDDTETPQPVPATRKRWWGQFVITTDGTWQLDNGLGDGTRFKMCRFTGDYIADNNISNAEHPLHYRGVSGALDNQNYLIVPGNEACYNDGEADPLSNDFSNTNTELHQIQDVATGTAPFGGNLSNSQWSVAGREQAATSLTPLPMF